jgi:hypothetical protein
LTIKEKEEMERETQRMARGKKHTVYLQCFFFFVFNTNAFLIELELDPEIKNTNRITPAAFLNKFRAKPVAHVPKPGANISKPSSDGPEM